MNEKLKNHFAVLFENAPNTRKALELKEELLANAEERYQDLLSDGISPEDATKNVIKSIGNVSELFQDFEELDNEEKFKFSQNAKKVAVYKTVAIGIYIFSAIVFLFFVMINSYQVDWYMGMNSFNYIWFGLILMMLIDIIPTCMLVYIFSLYPGYIKRNDTVVEEFKEWQVKTSKTKSIKLSVALVLWSFTLLVYFVVSFMTMAWYITWILFIVAICIQFIITLLFQIKEKRE